MKIEPGGLFDQTGIEAGHHVLEINGQLCPDSGKEAIALIQKTVGTLALATKPVVRAIPDNDDPIVVRSPDILMSAVVKRTKSTRVGISLARHKNKKYVFVSDVNENGLFHGTALKKGQQVLEINGLPCPRTATCLLYTSPSPRD